MLAIHPAGVVLTVLVTAALSPVRFRLLMALGAVLLGELFRLLLLMLLAGTVDQVTMGGLFSSYVADQTLPLWGAFGGPALTLLTGRLLGRGFGLVCAIYGAVAIIPVLLAAWTSH